MINQKISEKSNETLSLDFSLNNNQLNKLSKRIFTIKRQLGIAITLKLYPYLDKEILSEYEYC